MFACLLCAPPATGLAQDAVTRARSLYTAARYEDVLTMLEGVDTSDGSPLAFDVMRYRALCWLALGQDREAERAIAALVDLDPFYAPDADEVSPRADALTELGRLQAESASIVTPRTAASPFQSDSDATPFPLAQAFPAWAPVESLVARTEYDGAVRVWVDAAGRVTAAAIERATHPPYDRLVLETAREWRYRPARRGGMPVAAELLVEYSLRPPLRWQIFRSVQARR